MSLGITRENIMYNGAAYRGTFSTIDYDALKRARDSMIVKPRPSAYDLEKMRWDNLTGLNIFHPDDINSTVPIGCMKTNPNIMFAMMQACTPNQAWKDEQERLGLKTVFTDKPVIELTDRNGKTVPLIVGDKTENLVPLVMLAGLAYLLIG